MLPLAMDTAPTTFVKLFFIKTLKKNISKLVMGIPITSSGFLFFQKIFFLYIGLWISVK